MQKIPRIVMAASNSGAGKTTIVSGIMAGLRALGKVVQPYKVGPDYIDPGYHALSSGRAGHNLDTWLFPEEKLDEIFYKTAKDADIAVIEGVMGLYDGGSKGVSSTAAVAKRLGAPVVLVIDAKAMGESAAALALGFKTYDPDVNFAGVILNRLGSKNHEAMIREAMDKLHIPVLGAVYRDSGLQMPERHLGLTPVTETDAEKVMETIQMAISCQVSLEKLLEIAQAAPPLKFLPGAPILPRFPGVKVGVAHDDAFTFYYPESLQVLRDLGAELVCFSPLNDVALPKVDGLLIGGGFPEMFVKDLAANQKMRDAIATAGRAGLPIYAECGGLMYLTREMEGFDKKTYPMAGLIPARCRMNAKLQTVGYVEATALSGNLFCGAGTKIRGHEFHFSSMDVLVKGREEFPWAFRFVKTRTKETYISGYAKGNILASYLHLHFAANTALAENFLASCLRFKQGAERLG